LPIYELSHTSFGDFDFPARDFGSLLDESVQQDEPLSDEGEVEDSVSGPAGPDTQFPEFPSHGFDVWRSKLQSKILQ